MRAIGFFLRTDSTASPGISTSGVFFLSSRCGSLISLMALASSDADTSDSPALIAVGLPSWYCLRPPNVWLAFTPCWRATADTNTLRIDLPSTMAILSCAVRRRHVPARSES